MFSSSSRRESSSVMNVMILWYNRVVDMVLIPVFMCDTFQVFVSAMYSSIMIKKWFLFIYIYMFQLYKRITKLKPCFSYLHSSFCFIGESSILTTFIFIIPIFQLNVNIHFSTNCIVECNSWLCNTHKNYVIRLLDINCEGIRPDIHFIFTVDLIAKILIGWKWIPP